MVAINPTSASALAASKTATSEIGRPVCAAIVERQVLAATEVRLLPVFAGFGKGAGVGTQAARVLTDKQAKMAIGRIIANVPSCAVIPLGLATSPRIMPTDVGRYPDCESLLHSRIG